MIFVDSNVFMYAVGRSHPLRQEAQQFFEASLERGGPRLCTSAEVLQELLHAYLPVSRWATLDHALELADTVLAETWPVTGGDIRRARALARTHPHLQARDLLHLACCTSHGIRRIKTYNRALASALRP